MFIGPLRIAAAARHHRGGTTVPASRSVAAAYL